MKGGGWTRGLRFAAHLRALSSSRIAWEGAWVRRERPDPRSRRPRSWPRGDLAVNATADPKSAAAGGLQVGALLTAEGQVLEGKSEPRPTVASTGPGWEPKLLP